MKKIILASSSPYRKELLQRLAIDFECVSANVDEDQYKNQGLDPVKLSEVLAKAKAKEVFSRYPDAIVIGSDQVCFYEDKILGKSGTLEKAFENLKMLSGEEHGLSTAYCVLSGSSELTNVNITTLQMKKFGEESIKKYLSLDNPIDCAGSYKLELRGISLFSKIKTDDSTAIIGLPLISLSQDLEKLGVKLLFGRNE